MKITVSKSDTVTLKFTLKEDDLDYIVEATDTIIFTLKKNEKAKDVIIRKQVSGNGTNLVEVLLEKDDLKIPDGLYRYDLYFKDIDTTIIKPDDFEVEAVVHNE